MPLSQLRFLPLFLALPVAVACRPEGGSPSDSDDDTGESNVVDYGACSPPDVWTGDVPPELYTTTPWPSDYDAGLAAAHAAGRFQSSGTSYNTDIDSFTGATVVTVGTIGGGSSGVRFYVADANFTVPIIEMANGPHGLLPGQKVSWTARAYSGIGGDRAFEGVVELTVDSSDNPVVVRELDATALDYEGGGMAVLTHVAGSVDKLSSHDCGTGYQCFIFTHNGTEDLIRVPLDNTVGLDVDYDGGLCAELVAPVGRSDGTTGVAEHLDAREAAWIRTWTAPGA